MANRIMATHVTQVEPVDAHRARWHFSNTICDVPGDAFSGGFFVEETEPDGLYEQDGPNTFIFTYSGITIAPGLSWRNNDATAGNVIFNPDCEDDLVAGSGTISGGYKPPHPGMEGGMQHLDGGMGG